MSMGVICVKACQKCGEKVKVKKTETGVDDVCHNCGWKVNTPYAPLPSSVPTTRVNPNTPPPSAPKPALSPLTSAPAVIEKKMEHQAEPQQPPVEPAKTEDDVAQELATLKQLIADVAGKVEFVNSEQKRILCLLDTKSDKKKKKK